MAARRDRKVSRKPEAQVQKQPSDSGPVPSWLEEGVSEKLAVTLFCQ